MEVLAASTSCILATRFCATLIVRVTGTRTSCAARLVDGSEAGTVFLMLITNCCGKRRQSVSVNTSVFFALVVVVVKFLGNDPLPSAAFNSDFTEFSLVFAFPLSAR